jgi:putative MATE family efflux protein
VGFFFAEVFYVSQTENAAIIEYGKEYLFYICVFSIGFLIEVAFERLLLSTGKTLFSMISQGTGAVVNIILDPIFIFIFKMGVKGAAIATIIGQFVAAGIAMWLHFKYNKEVPISYKKFRPDYRVIGRILSVGIPSAIMGAVGSVMTYCMNRILGSFSDTAMSVFGAYFKLQSFIFMPVFGLNNGIVPILAYNFGARRPERMTKAIRLGVCSAVAIMAVGLLLFQTLPSVLLGFFNPSEAMLELGVPALRIISLCFLFAGYCIVVGSVFQALGHGVSSMLVSLIRQLLVLLPAAYILSKTVGLSAVWWAFPIAEIVSVCVSTGLFVRIWKKDIKPLIVK